MGYADTTLRGDGKARRCGDLLSLSEILGQKHLAVLTRSRGATTPPIDR